MSVGYTPRFCGVSSKPVPHNQAKLSNITPDFYDSQKATRSVPDARRSTRAGLLARFLGGKATWQGEVRTGTLVSRRDLRDPEFAREFLLGAVEEGIPVQVALGKVICATGVKEFAAKVRMASPNLLRAIDLRYDPTQGTLNRLLRSLKLRLTLR